MQARDRIRVDLVLIYGKTGQGFLSLFSFSIFLDRHLVRGVTPDPEPSVHIKPSCFKVYEATYITASLLVNVLKFQFKYILNSSKLL
jgi:hypothetical protein